MCTRLQMSSEGIFVNRLLSCNIVVGYIEQSSPGGSEAGHMYSEESAVGLCREIGV